MTKDSEKGVGNSISWFGIILFYLKYFLENSVNDFLFILAIRSTAQPELLLIDSQGTLMINILIQSQT